ncbi:MAG: membrane protein insertase YidC [Bacteroidales bacterium]|nr:membrane protein insertase YidC [Bacteroidales bacterium]
MDKNSIIGFILMAVILFGFTFYQNRQAKQQYELKQQQDSIAFAEAAARAAEQAEYQVAEEAAPAPAAAPAPKAQPARIYKDAGLDAARKGEAQILTLANDVFEVNFTTRGAQVSSVRLLDYTNYGGSDLYLFKEGQNKLDISAYVGEQIKTTDFIFEVAEKTDTSIVMRLPFENGGYIEQSYSIKQGAYTVDNMLSFVGVQIPRNVGSIDIDFSTMIPRMEKGYKNESQYSKVNYYFNGEKKPVEMGRARNQSKKISSKLEWFAFQQQFFSMIVRAPKEFSSGDISVAYQGEEDPDHNLMACEAAMRIDILPGQDIAIPLEYYFGPNHYRTLERMDHKYEKIIPLGGWLVGWFTRYFIIPMFDWLHKSMANFGLIILIMTLIIKLVTLPLTYKSFASSAKMAALRPYIEEINKKYAGESDQMKKQQATMDLYKRAGVNTLGGCLPTLLTFPVLWAMFRFFPASIELRQQSFLWAEDLSAYDSIVDFGARVPLIGDHLSLFALLMAVVMWGYSKMTMSQQTAGNDPSAKSMQFMSVWMMPIMMFFICNNLSSGLSYYYLLSQLIAIIETFVIRKWVVNPDAVRAKVEASKGKPLPKSKWQQRLEEAQKMQEQQMKNRNRK